MVTTPPPPPPGSPGRAATGVDEEQARALREAFLRNLGHELRTPLTTIRGIALTMLGDPEMPGAVRQDFLGILDRESERLRLLIEDMLTAERIDNGHRPRALATVDVVTRLEQLEEAVAAACAEAGVRLAIEVGRRPLRILAETTLLSQLERNLVGHALGRTPQGATVRIRAGVAIREGVEGSDGDDGDEGDEGRRVFLSVTDGGPALDAAEVATLFESFPRSTRAERTVYELGLGASLVARIARAHGWTATVNRMGNTITVSIPAAPGADAQI